MDASWRDWQDMLNSHGGREGEDRRPLPVRARIVWAVDGEEWIEGTATRSSGRLVFVEFRDRRSGFLGAWLDRADVAVWHDREMTQDAPKFIQYRESGKQIDDSQPIAGSSISSLREGAQQIKIGLADGRALTYELRNDDRGELVWELTAG